MSESLFAGLRICSTALPPHLKEQVRKIVTACKGDFQEDLTPDTTHLIALKVGTKKHRIAVQWKLVIATPDWVFHSFRACLRLDTLPFALKLLHGLVVSTTGLSLSSRDTVQQLLIKHGAEYDASLEVGRTSVLIAERMSGSKYTIAEASGIPIVHMTWLLQSVEKTELLEEADFALNKVLQPSRVYLQLQAQLEALCRDASGVWEDAKAPNPDIFDVCGFYLIGFTEQTQRLLWKIIRWGMGTIYHDWSMCGITHVIFSPAIENPQLALKVTANTESLCGTHCVSANWLMDSLEKNELLPEELYAVDLASQKATEVVETVLQFEQDYPKAARLPRPSTSEPVFQNCAFLFLCTDPSSANVKNSVKQIENAHKARAFAVHFQDVTRLEFVQFSMLTHIILCSACSISGDTVTRLQHSIQQNDPKKRLRFVSELWVRCCLTENHLFPRSAHELFSLDVLPRKIGEASAGYTSRLQIALPLPCFSGVSASVSVYVGTDRTVVLELLQLAGASVSRKLSKHHTHLICLKPFGIKYEKAKQWNIRTVNARWILQSIMDQTLADETLSVHRVCEDEYKSASSSLGTQSSQDFSSSLFEDRSELSLGAVPETYTEDFDITQL